MILLQRHQVILTEVRQNIIIPLSQHLLFYIFIFTTFIHKHIHIHIHVSLGVRFWDIRSSERTAEITDLHSNGVTSVHFNPKNNAEVLTTGRDSIVKLIDVRKSGQVLQSFFHSDFQIDLSYAGCTLSPDGKISLFNPIQSNPIHFIQSPQRSKPFSNSQNL